MNRRQAQWLRTLAFVALVAVVAVIGNNTHRLSDQSNELKMEVARARAAECQLARDNRDGIRQIIQLRVDVTPNDPIVPSLRVLLTKLPPITCPPTGG